MEVCKSNAFLLVFRKIIRESRAYFDSVEQSAGGDNSFVDGVHLLLELVSERGFAPVAAVRHLGAAVPNVVSQRFPCVLTEYIKRNRVNVKICVQEVD